MEGLFFLAMKCLYITDNYQRGLIFYGPPGNGKTISIKATMHGLTKRLNPTVETLYVKTLNSFLGPEYSILAIFQKARQMAPCMLVFEDIDSLINPGVRSYFLNAVDGLESNHGILMVGSTNHLERLDPGIAKRPSRFDRKYLFDLPTHDERMQYAQYWRHKLRDNKKIDFPEVLCGMIADITDEFSFAYMKEAFIATLLSIVRNQNPTKEESSDKTGVGDDDNGGGKGAAEKTILWKEFKKQVKILRDEMDNTTSSSTTTTLDEGIEKIDKSELDLTMKRLGLGTTQGGSRTWI
jgi:transitional endoplasmic reticulum ATPase